MIEKYALQSFAKRSTKERYLETLSYLEFLECFQQKAPEWHLPEDCHWLDVGAKNWSYVDALAAFIAKQTQTYSLQGVEIDGYRLYADLFTRKAYAESYIESMGSDFQKNRSPIRYYTEDVLTWPGTYDVISSFLPFVFEETSDAWGLPKATFQPLEYLERCLYLLKPGGVLLILNQGEWEADEQAKLLKQLSHAEQYTVLPLGQLPESFLAYAYPRHGFFVQKNAVRAQSEPVRPSEPVPGDAMPKNSQNAITITFASQNMGKLKELSKHIASANLPYNLALNPDAQDVDETGGSFMENALLKARQTPPLPESPWVLAEDSGLVVSALDGNYGISPFPGIYSNRWLTAAIREDLLAIAADETMTQAHKNQAILALLKHGDTRDAYFECGMVLLNTETGEHFESTGRTQLRVVENIEEARGTEGFGYDPIVIALEADGGTRTIAELSPDEKNVISHRGKAFQEILQHLPSQ